MLTTDSERRLKNEDQLSGFQRKKGAILFGAMPRDLRTGTPVAYKVVSGVEEREVDDTIEVENEDGEIERVKTKKVIKLEKNTWAFGVISGMQPAVDERGLHGSGYEITNADGSIVTVPRDAIITQEMHDFIKYRPTIMIVYQRDEPVMVALYTWDSMYLPCHLLKEYVPILLDDGFAEFVEKQKGYMVEDHKLTVSVVDANKNVHSFGPMTCSLFQNSDCRGCLSRLLNFSDNGWDGIRSLTKQLCGRWTMYADGNYVIRRYVDRELFIRFIEVEKWANIRSSKYLAYLVEEILAFQDEHGVGVPDHQLDTLKGIIKERLKTETAEIKKDGSKSDVDAFKEFKKQLNASVKKLKVYDYEEDYEEGEEEVIVD
jgi:hypothetical protein